MGSKRPLILGISIALTLILAIVLILSGCSSSSTPAAETNTPAATTSASGGQIIIGAVDSMTGDNTETGAQELWAYKQAVKDINAQGGIDVNGTKMPVRLIVEDDQSTSDGGAAAMEKLIKVDGAKIILSTNITPINQAAATVADKYHVYYAISCSWADVIAQGNYQWASDMFFSSADAATTPFLIWSKQPADQRPQRLAVLMEDDPDGAGFGQGFVAAAKKYGYDIVDMDKYTVGTNDYSSNILKMKSTNADALLWLGSTTDGITLIRQIKAANLNLKYIHGWKGMWPYEFQQSLGADANYIIHDGFWSPSFGAPGSEQLEKEFETDHNGQTSVTVGLYYASAQVVFQAIHNAGSTDPAKVRDAVFGHTFNGTTMGDVTFGSNGIWTEQALALQWMNGQSYPVWPIVSNYSLKWMPPWNQR